MKRTLRMLSFILAFSIILSSLQVPAYADALGTVDSYEQILGENDISENTAFGVSANDNREDDVYEEIIIEDENSGDMNLWEDGTGIDVSENEKDKNQEDVSSSDSHETISEINDEEEELPATGSDTKNNEPETDDTVIPDISDNEWGVDVSDNDEVPETGAGEVYRYTVITPVFSVPSSSVKAGQRVTLFSSTNGARIYYTTDGTKPSETKGLLYEDAFVITEAVTIKAIAVKAGYNNSSIVTAKYTIKDESADWGDIVETDRALFVNANLVPKSLWIMGITDVDYSGKANTFANLRVYSHKTLLTKSKDYTVKYSANTNAGTATLTITGKGNYAGSISRTFKINPLSLGNEDGNSEFISAPDIAYEYTGKTKKGTTNVTYKIGDKWVTLKKDVDFTYSYTKSDTYKKEGEHIVTIVGKGNFSGTATFKEYITSEKKTISSLKISKIKNVPFNMCACEPDVKIKDGDYTLVKELDYDLEYQNNEKPGTGTVIITGKGDYAGTKTVTFKITTISISEATVSGITSKEYTGTTAEQTGYELTYQSKSSSEPVILEEGRDYTVSYKSAVNVGKKATIVFSGINAYSGTLSKTYTIKARKLLEENVFPSEIGEVSYQKGGTKPIITVTAFGKALKEGTDYTVSFSNNKSVNDGTNGSFPLATITGKGNFKGTVTREFTISAGSLNYTRMTASDVVYEEAPGICKPAIALYDTNDAKLKAGTDYDKNNISYTYAEETVVKQKCGNGSFTDFVRDENEPVDMDRDIIPVGTEIKVTVFGKKNYAGTEQSAVFRIVQGDLSAAKVKIKTQYFDGKQIEINKSDITVTINKKNLSKTDYEIIGYANNFGKGTASVTLRGTGNYGGEKKCSFSIATKSIQYQIKYNNNDEYMNGLESFETKAAGTMKASDLANGKALTANAFSRSGFKFAGWNTKPDGTGESYKNKEKFKLKEIQNDIVTFGDKVTLYAIWKPVEYTISYVMGYSLKNTENPITYTIEDSIELINPERECYYFKGWYSDSKYKHATTEIEPGTTGNLTIYGKLVPFKYTIKFNANEGSGKMASLTDCAYGTSYTLPEVTFTRTNYRFLSWNTKKDGSGTKYKANAKVSKLCKEDGGSITLYAQWEAYTEQYIWDTLMAAIGNEFGVAGLMGNLFAESGLKSNNLQNTYEKSLGYSDDEYTKAVDSGKYTKEQFVKDKAGYGLAQWTSQGRKERLYDYAKARGKSIGDLDVQLGFLIYELKTFFGGVWNALVNATSVKGASDVVLTQFERPADQSDAAKYRRAGYGNTFYDQYADGASDIPKGYIKVVVKEALKVRSGPGTDTTHIATLGAGTVCYITEIKPDPAGIYDKGWGRLSDGTGWICLNYVDFK